jgi:hypothetical protein
MAGRENGRTTHPLNVSKRLSCPRIRKTRLVHALGGLDALSR